jgi:hypothetical protein
VRHPHARTHAYTLLPGRLDSRAPRLPILLKTARGLAVFAASKLLVPLLFFLSQGSLERRGLPAVKVQGCAFEECGVLRDKDMLD